MAYLSSGRGIVIHRDNCANVEGYHKHPEKWQPVTWQSSLTRYFSCEVRIETANRVGMLAAISAAIAGLQTNIGHATVEQRDGDVAVITLGLEVRDRVHLARVVRAIHRMPDVLHVGRTLARHPGAERRRARRVTPRSPDA